MMVKVLGTLAVVGFVHPFWWLMAGVVAIGWVAHRGYVTAVGELQARRARAALLVDALEQQDRWWMQGDPRGTYGSSSMTLPNSSSL